MFCFYYFLFELFFAIWLGIPFHFIFFFAWLFACAHSESYSYSLCIYSRFEGVGVFMPEIPLIHSKCFSTKEKKI